MISYYYHTAHLKNKAFEDYNIYKYSNIFFQHIKRIEPQRRKVHKEV